MRVSERGVGPAMRAAATAARAAAATGQAAEEEGTQEAAGWATSTHPPGRSPGAGVAVRAGRAAAGLEAVVGVFPFPIPRGLRPLHQVTYRPCGEVIPTPGPSICPPDLAPPPQCDMFRFSQCKKNLFRSYNSKRV